MALYPESTDLIAQVKRLEARIEALERSPRIGDTAIDNGSLILRDDQQNELVRIGDIYGNGGQHGIGVLGAANATVQGGSLVVLNPDNTLPIIYAGDYTASSLVRPDGKDQMVFIVYRDTGEVALAMFDGNTGDGYQQALQWFDRTGHIVLADDTNSGTGLARPYIQYFMTDTNTATWFNTTAASFTDIGTTWFNMQHPKMEWAIWCFVDTATQGEYRVIINGVQVGSTFILTGSSFQVWNPAAGIIPNFNFGANGSISLQARRNSGTGNVKATVLLLQGHQT